MNNPLFLVITIPFIVAIINLVLPVVLRKILSFIGLAYTLFLSIQILIKDELTYTLFGKVILQNDNLSNFILVFISILSVIILIYSLKNVDKGVESKYFLLLPATVAFCNGVALSVNMYSFIIFWGLSGLMVYLFGLLNSEIGAESSKKTFLIIGASDSLLILGFAALFHISGGASNIFRMNVDFSAALNYVAFFCLLLSSFAKAGAFPMHSWIPDFAKDAPIESVALLPAALDKLLGIYFLARIMMNFFQITLTIKVIVMCLGAFTIVIAVMMALIQHNGRKLLGYHAVSQVGYMVLGIGTGNPIGIIGGLFHMINHAIYKSNLFLSFGSVEKKTGTADLDDMGGLARKMPLTFIGALIGALAISGVPPLNGFVSKWLVYQGVLQEANGSSQIAQIIINICLIFAVFGSALTLASFMKFLHAIFLSRLPKKYENIKEISANNWIANMLLSLLCVIFGLFAMAIPIKIFIAPSLPGHPLVNSMLLGFYQPGVILLLFGVAFVVGIILFLLIKNIRFDDIYVGGMEGEEKHSVPGTDFYNDIRNMSPLRKLYDWAERKFFDIYDMGRKFVFFFSEIFQELHTGLLHTYAMWILAGFIIITIIVLSYVH